MRRPAPTRVVVSHPIRSFGYEKPSLRVSYLLLCRDSISTCPKPSYRKTPTPGSRLHQSPPPVLDNRRRQNYHLRTPSPLSGRQEHQQQPGAQGRRQPLSWLVHKKTEQNLVHVLSCSICRQHSHSKADLEPAHRNSNHDSTHSSVYLTLNSRAPWGCLWVSRTAPPTRRGRKRSCIWRFGGGDGGRNRRKKSRKKTIAPLFDHMNLG